LAFFFNLSTCSDESFNNVAEVFFFFSSLVSFLPKMSGSVFNSKCSKRGSEGVCENLRIVLSKNDNSLASSVSPLAILAHEFINLMIPNPSAKGWRKATPIAKPSLN
jgi:hypothetical protein